MTMMIVNPHRTPGSCFRHPPGSWAMAGRSAGAMVAAAGAGGTAVIAAMVPMEMQLATAWPAPMVVTMATVVIVATNAVVVKNSGPGKQRQASPKRRVKGSARGNPGINSANSSAATQLQAAPAGKTSRGSAVLRGVFLAAEGFH
jgi:hypothetical protein